MRTIKELLELMLENQQCFERGLCYWVSEMYSKSIIKPFEYIRLMDYICSNKPTFFENPRYYFSMSYYWKKGNIKPRLKWIKKHIKINS